MSASPPARALAEAVRVTEIGPGHYEASLSEHFSIMGHPNGGYLECVVAEAARDAAARSGSAHRDVVAMTASFVGGTRAGQALVAVEVTRVGRGVTFVEAKVSQADRLCVSALVTLGSIGAEARYQSGEPPELPPLEDCPASERSEELDVRSVIEVRLDPATATWRSGGRGRGEVRAWLRLDDGSGRRWDPSSLLFALDALPPATFPLGSVGWVPTLHMTSYVRRVPEGEWLRGRQWCEVVAGDLVDERCDLFDESGALVATSSQVAMVRFEHGA